jgi:hypothetical protein
LKPHGDPPSAPRGAAHDVRRAAADRVQLLIGTSPLLSAQTFASPLARLGGTVSRATASASASLTRRARSVGSRVVGQSTVVAALAQFAILAAASGGGGLSGVPGSDFPSRIIELERELAEIRANPEASGQRSQLEVVKELSRIPGPNGDAGPPYPSRDDYRGLRLRQAFESGDPLEVHLAYRELATMHGPHQEYFAQKAVDSALALGFENEMLARRDLASNPNQPDRDEQLEWIENARLSDRWESLAPATRFVALLVLGRGWELGDHISVAYSLQYARDAAESARDLYARARDADEERVASQAMYESHLWIARHPAMPMDERLEALQVVEEHTHDPHQVFNRDLTMATVHGVLARAGDVGALRIWQQAVAAAVESAKGGWQKWEIFTVLAGGRIPTFVGREIAARADAQTYTDAAPAERLEHARTALQNAYSRDQKTASQAIIEELTNS